jgi:hypothetical protein
MYGNKWKKIAAHVGDGVTNLQVCARYRIICPQHLAAVEEYEWTPEKVRRRSDPKQTLPAFMLLKRNCLLILEHLSFVV